MTKLEKILDRFASTVVIASTLFILTYMAPLHYARKYADINSNDTTTEQEWNQAIENQGCNTNNLFSEWIGIYRIIRNHNKPVIIRKNYEKIA